MASYKDKILEVIGESEVGLTTVDVAKKAGVSKTTVIKYLSVISSEGMVEFVEVGRSKLWRNKRVGPKREPESPTALDVEALPMVDVDFNNGDEKTVYFSFRMDPDQICTLMKRAHKCMFNLAEPC